MRKAPTTAASIIEILICESITLKPPGCPSARLRRRNPGRPSAMLLRGSWLPLIRIAHHFGQPVPMPLMHSVSETMKGVVDRTVVVFVAVAELGFISPIFRKDGDASDSPLPFPVFAMLMLLWIATEAFEPCIVLAHFLRPHRHYGLRHGVGSTQGGSRYRQLRVCAALRSQKSKPDVFCPLRAGVAGFRIKSSGAGAAPVDRREPRSYDPAQDMKRGAWPGRMLCVVPAYN
jgi:hypothetical protein